MSLTLNDMQIKDRRTQSFVDEQTAMEQARAAMESVGATWTYAVMDHAVAFGWCRDGDIVLVVDGCPAALDSLRYVQELRLFGEAGEFKAVRTGETFCCRVLEEDESANGVKYTVYEETHKLWGTVDTSGRHGRRNVPGWCMLSSDRGTCLYVPEPAGKVKSRGLLVRSYIEFSQQRPAANETDDVDSSLYRFVDERFVRFVDWHERGAES